ncbi:hypothetical protein DMX02_18560 [Pseudomonas jessenii]|nr:hypothetical protein DMX02_18560 [Pseudomonas jessenii]
MQIVVPRTCDDSCTGLLKRDACQVASGALARARGLLRVGGEGAEALCVGARLHRDAARLPLIRWCAPLASRRLRTGLSRRRISRWSPLISG